MRHFWAQAVKASILSLPPASHPPWPGGPWKLPVEDGTASLSLAQSVTVGGLVGAPSSPHSQGCFGLYMSKRSTSLRFQALPVVVASVIFF